MRYSQAGWWCRLVNPREIDAPFDVLSETLQSLYLSCAEVGAAAYYLMAKWKHTDTRTRTPEEMQRELLACPGFAQVESVWFIAYPEMDVYNFGDCWEEFVNEDDWLAGVVLDDDQVSWLRRDGELRFYHQPSEKCLARAEESINHDFVYRTEAEAIADRVASFPRLQAICELEKELDLPVAEWCRAILQGQDELSKLVGYLESVGDPRAERVKSWLLENRRVG